MELLSDNYYVYTCTVGSFKENLKYIFKNRKLLPSVIKIRIFHYYSIGYSEFEYLNCDNINWLNENIRFKILCKNNFVNSYFYSIVNYY